MNGDAGVRLLTGLIVCGRQGHSAHGWQGGGSAVHVRAVGSRPRSCVAGVPAWDVCLVSSLVLTAQESTSDALRQWQPLQVCLCVWVRAALGLFARMRVELCFATSTNCAKQPSACGLLLASESAKCCVNDPS